MRFTLGVESTNTPMGANNNNSIFTMGCIETFKFCHLFIPPFNEFCYFNQSIIISTMNVEGYMSISKGWVLFLAGTVFLLSCSPNIKPVEHLPEGKKVVGYYPSWAANRGIYLKDTSYTKLSHINYAFSNVSISGECILGDFVADVGTAYLAENSVSGKADKEKLPFHGNFNQILELKKVHPELKVFISVDGWTWSENFSNAAKDETSRMRFSTSCIDLYFKQYEGVFDGIDIDWEYPISGGLTDGSPEDKENYTLLLKLIRSQLNELEKQNRKTYLLTIAVPASPSAINNFDLAGIISVVDWVNLMAYDLHGTWEPITNFNAPLFKSADDPASDSLNVDYAVQNLLKLGVPPDKLVLGVPFYGKGWAGVPDINNGLFQTSKGAAPGTHEPGSFDFSDIKNHYLATWPSFWSDEAYVPWLYDSTKQIFISYDDERSLEAKAGYANDQGLAGVMIWDISQGGESLFEGIYRGFERGGPDRPTPQPVTFLSRPFEQPFILLKVSMLTASSAIGQHLLILSWIVQTKLFLNLPQIAGKGRKTFH